MDEQQQPKKSMGCFAKGCLVVLAVLVIFGAIGGVGAFWLYRKTLDTFSSDRPANVALEQPTTVALQQAEGKLHQLRTAVRDRTGTRIEFAAADLNTLIARDPAFVGLRGKARVGMAGDDMIVDVSAPLNSSNLPGLKGRWFNGRIQFRFGYEFGDFWFQAHLLETNGHRMASGPSDLSSSFMRGFSSAFGRNFNKGFRNGQVGNPQGEAFWKQIKSMSVQNERLVVETQGDSG